ncbi:fimbrial protein [Morganella morganii]
MELGEHSVADLKNKDDKTQAEEFDISLINCSLAMTSLKIKMEGTAHKDNAALYALDAGEKSAGNVGIAVTDKQDQPITPAGIYQNIALKNDSRDYTLTYKAAYQATGLATPGTGNATINYTVSYE